MPDQFSSSSKSQSNNYENENDSGSPFGITSFLEKVPAPTNSSVSVSWLAEQQNLTEVESVTTKL